MLRTRMWWKVVVLLCLALLSTPTVGKAASVADMADVLSAIGDVMRSADDARDMYYRNRSGQYAELYERAWREQEYLLEEVRIREMAREARVSPEEIGRMRADGRDWREIADRYRLDYRRFGYGYQSRDGYDRDRDRDVATRCGPPGRRGQRDRRVSAWIPPRHGASASQRSPRAVRRWTSGTRIRIWASVPKVGTRNSWPA